MPLQLVLIMLDRVHVMTESEQRRRVGSEPLELVEHVDDGAARGPCLPAAVQPLEDARERRIKRRHAPRGERLRNQPPLGAPGVAFGRKYAGDLQLREDRLDPIDAPVVIRARSQDLIGEQRIGDDHRALRARSKRVQRAMCPRPALQYQVQAP